MKFFRRESEKTILFLCVEHTGRSRITEGFFNKAAPKGYRAIGAGTTPLSQLNPLAVEVMKEVGIDILPFSKNPSLYAINSKLSINSESWSNGLDHIADTP